MKEEDILLREMIMNIECTYINYELLEYYKGSYMFAKLNLDHRINKLKNDMCNILINEISKHFK